MYPAQAYPQSGSLHTTLLVYTNLRYVTKSAFAALDHQGQLCPFKDALASSGSLGIASPSESLIWHVMADGIPSAKAGVTWAIGVTGSIVGVA